MTVSEANRNRPDKKTPVPYTVGNLKILRRTHKTSDKWYVEVECYCGNTFNTREETIRGRRALSCGCRGTNNTHGMHSSPEYQCWADMKGRCSNIKNKNYHNYGGRGITVCEEWRNSFEAFYTDMGEKPFPKAQLDRIDNNNGYSKENCRWVTSQVNIGNRRITKLITYLGLTAPLSDWCRATGISRPVLDKRVFDLKWDLDKAFMLDIKLGGYPSGKDKEYNQLISKSA